MQISWQAQRISHSHPLTLPLADSHLLSLTLALTFISRLSAYRPHIHCLGSLAGIIFVFSSWVVFFCIFKNFVLSKNTTMSYFLHFLISLVFVFFVFFIFSEMQKKGSYFFVFSKMQTFSLELRTGKNHRQIFSTTSETWWLPDNHERLLQKTRGPTSHPTHINAYQVAICVNIACNFAFLLGLYVFLKNAKITCVLKNTIGELIFSNHILFIFLIL